MKATRIAVLVASWLMPTLAFGSPTESVYRGVLKVDGVPAAAGATSMRFEVFSGPSGGEPLWSADQMVTVAEEGHFSVPLDLDHDRLRTAAEWWLQVSVDGTALSGRQLIPALPAARNAEALSGFTVEELAGPGLTFESGVGLALMACDDDGDVLRWHTEAGAFACMPDLVGATTFEALEGGLADSQIPTGVARDDEIDGLASDAGYLKTPEPCEENQFLRRSEDGWACAEAPGGCQTFACLSEPGACAPGEVLARNSGDDGWECVSDQVGCTTSECLADVPTSAQCAADQYLRRNATNTRWECAAADISGGLTFADIGGPELDESRIDQRLARDSELRTEIANLTFDDIGGEPLEASRVHDDITRDIELTSALSPVLNELAAAGTNAGFADLAARLSDITQRLVVLEGRAESESVWVDSVILSVPGQYADVQAALESLDEKLIRRGATVTISIAEGTYGGYAPIVVNHRDGRRIQILGEGSGATLVFNSGGDGLSVAGAGGLGLVDNITLEGADVGSNGLVARDGAFVDCGADFAVRAFVQHGVFAEGARIRAEQTRSSENGGSGYMATSGGHIDARGASSANNGSWGFLADRGGRVIARQSSASGNVNPGFSAMHGGYVYAQGAQATGALNGPGFIAQRLGVIEAEDSRANGNALSGFVASQGGVIRARNAVAVGNSGDGFFADKGGLIYAEDSYAGTDPLNPDDPADRNLGSGYVADFGSVLVVDGATARNNSTYGFFSNRGSTLVAESSSAADNGSNGYFADGGSSIDARFAVGNDNGADGFNAQKRSLINAPHGNPGDRDAQAPTATGNAGSGYSANWGGTILADFAKATANGSDGFVASSGSLIRAEQATAIDNRLGFSGLYNSTLYLDGAQAEANDEEGFRAQSGTVMRANGAAAGNADDPADAISGNGTHGFRLSGGSALEASSARAGHSGVGPQSGDGAGFLLESGSVVVGDGIRSAHSESAGVRVLHNSAFVGENAVAEHNGDSGFEVDTGSVLAAGASTSRNNGGHGYYAQRGSVIDAPFAHAGDADPDPGAQIDRNSLDGFHAESGSTIHAAGARSGRNNCGFCAEDDAAIFAADSTTTSNDVQDYGATGRALVSELAQPGDALAVATRLDTLEAEVPRLIGDTTLRVPEDHGNINEALAWLGDKLIREDSIATVEVADGTYEYSEPIEFSHVHGDRIHIVARVVESPPNVVLRFTGSDGLRIDDGSRLGRFDGFILDGNAQSSNKTGIAVTHLSQIEVGADVLVRQFGGIGFSADTGALLRASQTESRDNVGGGYHADRGAVIVAQGSLAVGGRRGFRALRGSGLHVDAAVARNSALFGFQVEHSSWLRGTANEASDTGSDGFLADHGSAIDAPGSTVLRAGGHGFAAIRSSSVSVESSFAGWDPADPDNVANGVASSGFMSSQGSSMHASGSVSSYNREHGFLATGGSYLVASHSDPIDRDAQAPTATRNRMDAYTSLDGSVLIANHTKATAHDAGNGYASEGHSLIRADAALSATNTIGFLAINNSTLMVDGASATMNRSDGYRGSTGAVIRAASATAGDADLAPPGGSPSGNAGSGFELDAGSVLFGESAKAGHNNGAGFHIGRGSAGVVSSGRAAHNGGAGFDVEIGSSLAAELAHSVENTTHGFRVNHASALNVGGAQATGNAHVGVFAANNAAVRGPDVLSTGNADGGEFVRGSMFDGGGSTFSGNTDTDLLPTQNQLSFDGAFVNR